MLKTSLSEPCDEDSEKALLSSMIQDSSLLDKYSEADCDLFYNPCHRHIFSALLKLKAEGAPVDFVLILGRLRSEGLEEETGGKEYLNSIWEFAPSPQAWEYYHVTLVEKLDLRRALEMSRRVAVLAEDNKPNLEEIQRIANSYKLTTRHQDDIATVASSVLDLSELLEKVQSGTLDDPGVDWGFAELDSMIDKLRPGELCLVGGFPGSGKTSILNSIVAHTCVPQKRPSLVYSLEMPVLDEVMRLVSIAGRIPISRMRKKGGMCNIDMSSFSESARQIYESRVAIVDEILNIQEIYGRSREYKERYGLDFIGIDHAQLIKVSGTGEGARRQGLDEAGRICKYMAKDLNCVVMLLTQINRMDESPFECTSLEAHCDQYIIVPKSEVKRVNVRKQRNGPVGHIELNFYPECAAFY